MVYWKGRTILSNRLLIGEFSERTGVSKRMLRHYDEIGLLMPSETDRMTGYRYYEESQQDRVAVIIMLSRLGFPLKEMSDILNGNVDDGEFLELLKTREADLRISIDKDTGILLRIRRLIKLYGFQVALKESLTECLHQIDSEQDENRSSQMEKDKNVGKDNSEIRDLLSNLPGADLFYEKIEHIVQTSESIEEWSFITFDIDKFLKVNDDCGYETGDKVIYTVMKSILDMFPPVQNRILASRLGGDELGIFISGMDTEEITEKVQEVIGSIAEFNYSSLGCPETITVSAGIYRTKNLSHHAELRHNSTKALLQAKRQGGNRYSLIHQ